MHIDKTYLGLIPLKWKCWKLNLFHKLWKFYMYYSLHFSQYRITDIKQIQRFIVFSFLIHLYINVYISFNVLDNKKPFHVYFSTHKGRKSMLSTFSFLLKCSLHSFDRSWQVRISKDGFLCSSSSFFFLSLFVGELYLYQHLNFLYPALDFKLLWIYLNEFN